MTEGLLNHCAVCRGFAGPWGKLNVVDDTADLLYRWILNVKAAAQAFEEGHTMRALVLSLRNAEGDAFVRRRPDRVQHDLCIRIDVALD